MKKDLPGTIPPQGVFLGPNCPSTCIENSLRRIQGIKSLPDNSPAMDTQDHWAAASAWTNARRTSSPSKAASTICTQWTHKIISHVLRVRMQAIAAEDFGRYLEKPDASGPRLFYALEAVSLWDELELPVAFWPEAASFDDADEPFESVEGDDEPEPLPFDAF